MKITIILVKKLSQMNIINCRITIKLPLNHNGFIKLPLNHNG